jgi:hypothetical protein
MLKQLDDFLQISEHAVFVTQRTNHTKSEIVAKRMIDIKLARSIWSEKGIVESYILLVEIQNQFMPGDIP